jgi:hypothetical protein
MRRFCWALICGIPKALWNAVDLTLSVAAAVVFLVMLFNRRLGERLLMSWHAISPWWSLVPIAMIVIYGLMRSNYEHYCHLESGLNQSVLDLKQENSALKAEISDLRNPKVSPEEQERRQQVREILKACNFSKETKAALRSALNFEGEIRPATTRSSPFGSRASAEIMHQGVGSGLITGEGKDATLKIRPCFQAALRFLLENEEP